MKRGGASAALFAPVAAVISRRAFLPVLGLSLTLGGCKIVATAKKKSGDDSLGGDFDPAAKVRAIWDAKVIPYLEAKAGKFSDVAHLAQSDPNAAGRQYGYRAEEGSAPWTLVVKLEGRIVAAETTSRAATISVDDGGDGKTAAIVQIGPAIRGTALRDALSFVSFNDFKNQIDYAQFGKAFNQYANETFLSHLPRDKLVGASVSLLGAYPLEAGDHPPLITPARLKLEPAS